jgi:glucose/arabinose dehydrogenase
MENGGQTPMPKSHRIQLIILAVLLVVAVALVGWLLLRRPVVAPAPTSNKTPSPVKVQLALFASGIEHPTSITSTGLASDERLFVLDQSGKIRVINGTGTVVGQPFLDISSQTRFEGEMGLLGMAFSPHYATDGYFYVDYIDKDMNTTVARYHISSDANTADISSAQIILKQKQPYTNHNGGALAFGSDGYLYIAFGDGGSAGDPEKRAQDMNSWFGKLLRIDVSKLPYTVPSSNPFVGQAGVKPEIWDSGLRNPWRISFDSKTHDLYIADVGQGEVEEINVEPAGKGGKDYGWRCYEGDKEFKLDGCQDKSKYVFPALTYGHAEGRCSVTGGYVYRGQDYPDLTGKYFYGDYCGGQVYFMEKQSDNSYKPTEAFRTPYKISTFGQDSSGELYLADYASGAIYHLQDAQ